MLKEARERTPGVIGSKDYSTLVIRCYRRDYLRTTVGAPARIFGDDFSLGD